MSEECTVFVTVGTTQFTQLIAILQTEEFGKWAESSKYTGITVQLGSDPIEVSEVEKHLNKFGLEVKVFRYKESIQEELKDASLIITHAGAGSLIECVRLQKNTIAVVNDTLIGNHQTELAEALSEQKICLATTPAELVSTLNSMDPEFSQMNGQVQLANGEDVTTWLSQELQVCHRCLKPSIVFASDEA
eukprot:Clim_evm78s128 gene=Clim_evmTU78s128